MLVSKFMIGPLLVEVIRRTTARVAAMVLFIANQPQISRERRADARNGSCRDCSNDIHRRVEVQHVQDLACVNELGSQYRSRFAYRWDSVCTECNDKVDDTVLEE